MSNRVSSIKRAQKESLLMRSISQLLMQISLDDSRIADTFINRVSLSDSKSMCVIYFYSPRGQDYFKEILKVLILYKPSMRAAIAKIMDARYTPDLVFKFDEQFEKQLKLENLLDTVKSVETTDEEK
ncbi:MAG: ribosome-binding factor A [Candidatus Babeliales bacterium]